MPLESPIVGGSGGGTPGDPGPIGPSANLWAYAAETTVGGDPSDGHVRWDNATQISATALVIDLTTANGEDVTSLLKLLTTSNRIALYGGDSTDYQLWQVTGAVTYHAAQGVEVPVSLVSSGGAGTTGFVAETNLSLAVLSVGSNGATGATGPSGDQPLASATQTCHDSGTHSQTLYTVPGSGTNRALAWQIVGRISTKLVGSGSVTIKVGLTAGGEQFIKSYTVDSTKDVGTLIGADEAELGTGFLPGYGYQAPLDGAATIISQEVAAGTVTTPPVIDWKIMGAVW